MSRAILAFDPVLRESHRFIQRADGWWRHDINSGSGYLQTCRSPNAVLCCTVNGYQIKYDSDSEIMGDDAIDPADEDHGNRDAFLDRVDDASTRIPDDESKPAAWWPRDWSRRESAMKRRGRRS